MSILPDRWIIEQAKKGMIDPFSERQVAAGTISSGVSSYGYDARAAREFKIFTNVDNTIIDPKNFSESSFVEREADVCILPPNSFALARTVEYFRIPRDVLVICLGKSTYARCGIIANVTPAEAGWKGHLTLEFSNSSAADCRIYANEGVVQMLFFQGERCGTSYRTRRGKYQNQKQRVTLPKV